MNSAFLKDKLLEALDKPGWEIRQDFVDGRYHDPLPNSFIPLWLEKLFIRVHPSIGPREPYLYTTINSDGDNVDIFLSNEDTKAVWEKAVLVGTPLAKTYFLDKMHDLAKRLV